MNNAPETTKPAKPIDSRLLEGDHKPSGKLPEDKQLNPPAPDGNQKIPNSVNDTSMIAYLHNLSPIKKSQKNNMYFDMTLQTKSGTYRSVCFSPEKHAGFSSKYESSSPVKISKFQLKRNKRSNQDEIHINKRSKLEDPQESEVTFDIKKVESEEKCKPGITAVLDVLEGANNAVVNVCGRITLHGAEETILSKGKTLRKQEAKFTDNSGTMRLVLWESDITRVTSKSVYTISKVVVREFDSAKYLTLNKQSIITLADTSIDRLDTEADGLPQSQKVDCPAEGVLSVQRFLSCKKCQTKLVPDPTKNLVKCTECGMAQLKSKCVQRLMANVMFGKADSTVSLLLFDDKLKHLYNVYKRQTNTEETFDSVDDDTFMEFLLTVEASVFYNAKKNVLSVTEKDN